MYFCLITFEFADHNQGNINNYSLFKTCHQFMNITKTNKKKPTPNPDYVLEATKQNIPTTETQPENKEHVFFLMSQKPE